MKKHVFIISLILISGMIPSCSKPPIDEMIKAEKALEQAKQNEADIYAQDSYSKIEETYKKAKELVSAKRYKEARAVAKEVYQLAQRAILLTESNKLMLKAQAEQMIKDVQGKIDKMRSMASKIFKKKDTLKRKQLQETIQKWETDLADIIENQLKAQKIRYAFDKLKVLIAEVNAKEKILLPRRDN